jgi:enoyl-CoA hydratase/carnithine racemase
MIGAADALFAGMADYHVPRTAWDTLISSLRAQAWERTPQTIAESALIHAKRVMNDDHLNCILHELSTPPAPAIGPLQTHQALIQRLCSGSNLEKIVSNILALSDHTDPWLARAAKTLAAGSPGSARLTFTLLQRTKHVSLAEVYRIEWVAGLICTVHGDFEEGIRALLIDKDKQPKWNPATLALATPEWVEKFFTLPFPAHEHPLDQLGASA